MKISVLIPTKNEPLINELVQKVHEVIKKFDHEIIVIDKSDTLPNIHNTKLIIQKSDGLGKAILEGLKYAKGNVIVTMDGDFSHDPNDLPKLLKKTDEYDIVIGSRFVPGGKMEYGFDRKIVSLFFRKITSLILNLNIEDSMSGFCAIKKNVYDNLNLNPLGYKINMEIMFKAKKKNYKITEIPINFHDRKAGKSKAGFSLSGIKEAFRILIYTFELKFGLR
jgi:dolichol-phosphate mannosyltransferase